MSHVLRGDGGGGVSDDDASQSENGGREKQDFE